VSGERTAEATANKVFPRVASTSEKNEDNPLAGAAAVSKGNRRTAPTGVAALVTRAIAIVSVRVLVVADATHMHGATMGAVAPLEPVPADAAVTGQNGDGCANENVVSTSASSHAA
jgi:tetrahydromethanopterin S-methyltransferase subunit A